MCQVAAAGGVTDEFADQRDVANNPKKISGLEQRDRPVLEGMSPEQAIDIQE
jgi:hypothetical protein